jgi:MFS family permease
MLSLVTTRQLDSAASAAPTAPDANRTAIEARAYRRVTLRLIPFLFLCYVVAYLDRVNVGFAKLQMLRDVSMSDTAYGTGAGIFFLGYFLFEVPSNLMLQRFGARTWIARIMVTWGVLSICTMFVTSATTFYVVRFLLGLAEAGFFPGIILYLTQWYPVSRRARVIALFMTAVAVSGIIGGPISGWILIHSAGVLKLAGWQWLFLLEGLPSLVMGAAVYLYLDDSMEQARWLPEDERAVLRENLRREESAVVHSGVLQTLRDRRVILLAAIYFCFVMSNYGIAFWLPQLIRGMGVLDEARVGVLSAVPYVLTAVAMVLIGRSSDRRRERRWHLVTCAVTSPVFWTLPTALLRGASAAAGIAAINSIGNLAGFLGPYLIGVVRDATGKETNALFAIAAFALCGAALVIVATRTPPPAGDRI